MWHTFTIFTDSVLWAGSVIELTCPPVWLYVCDVAKHPLPGVRFFCWHKNRLTPPPSICVSAKKHVQVSLRLLVEENVPNIGLQWHNLKKKCCVPFFLFAHNGGVSRGRSGEKKTPITFFLGIFCYQCFYPHRLQESVSPVCRIVYCDVLRVITSVFCLISFTHIVLVP